MKKCLKFFVIIGLTLALFCPCAISDDKGKKKAMDNCVKKEIKDTSVVIDGKYSDPGGLKKKSAKERCEYEKSKSAKKFNKKYGDEKEINK